MRPGESSEQEVLNRLAAIRAAAEILDDNDDLSSSDRRLFLLVIQTETTRLHRMRGMTAWPSARPNQPRKAESEALRVPSRTT